jgi:hypothetical protein
MSRRSAEDCEGRERCQLARATYAITQQATRQKVQVTGQTGSGQARLTLGGSNRRCPRDWNGAPLSGSHLGPHAKPQGPCNKAVSREAVCSSFTLFNAAS